MVFWWKTATPLSLFQFLIDQRKVFAYCGLSPILPKQ